MAETLYGTTPCPEPIDAEGTPCGLTADVYDLGTLRKGEFQQYRIECSAGHHRIFDSDFSYLEFVTPL